MQGETGRLRVVVPEDSARHGRTPSEGASPGQLIREQRKRRGMSIEQLAAATKIPRRSLECLEDDRYEGLPGPVFTKGFLRCAARAVGLDVQLVMDQLYERERAALALRKNGRVSVPSPEELPPAGARQAVSRRRVVVSPAAAGRWDLVRARLPSPAVFLWVLVAAFVAMVVLAAFNLVGGTPPGHI